MDMIPGKWRRKPKPLALQTSITNGAASDTSESITSIDSSTSQTQTTQKAASKPVIKKLSLRNIRIPRTGKRTRDSPPAELRSSPPQAAVVGQDGVASHGPASSPTRPTSHGSTLDKPTIPTFLTLSAQDIELAFQELTWIERNRIARGLRSDKPEDYKWVQHRMQSPTGSVVMDRYVNIKPWGHNRVKLQVPSDELDYVNASLVALSSASDGTLTPLNYIAMQGPTQPSFSYVWRMVAEQTTSPSVIVQLTTMLEGGVVKCNQYFPDDPEQTTWNLNEDDVWGDGWKATLTYDSLEELSNGAIERRKLLLQVQGEEESRIVWHFLYKRWPDFGVPALDDLDSFFELMKLSREHGAALEPRIIHCSAGIGRTGTFICLEHLIRELETGALERFDASDDNADLIFKTVDILREQRPRMVQSEVQYEFIYQVMRKLWQDKYGVADDGAGTQEPAAKRLEVADPFSESASNPEAEAMSDAPG